ncbi:MAG: nitrophenyl compound nitroreductase subunit ArsF family protein [Dehalococcoidia bacterium]
MNRSFRFIVYSMLAVIILAGLFTGCSSQDTEQEPMIVPAPSTPSEQPSKPPETLQENPPVETVNRVDIVYFYPEVRCGSCISVELRTQDLLEKSFKDAMDSGKLTFLTYVLDDEQNAAEVEKYGALSSQLFINTIKDNTENIMHVEDIWMPRILNDGVAFDEYLSGLIEEALEEVS